MAAGETPASLVQAPAEAGADPADRAWRTIMDLVGWGPNRAPRFPMVAIRLDLSPKQLGMLWNLDPDGPGQPMGAIAESLYCDASYVTDMVDKLEQRGLIERRPSPEDRRVKLLALTASGRRLRKKALAMLFEPPEEFSRLSESERQQLAELLERLL